MNRELEEAGIPHSNLSLNRVDPKTFREAIIKGKAANRHGWKVDVKDEKKYKYMRLFLTSDGNAGIAITKGGDVVSVFSSVKGSKSLGKLIPYAVALGGKKLDCYGDKLAEMYAQYGARPTGRLKFNDEYAPPGWDGQERPDVYAMVLPKSFGELKRKYNSNAEVDENKVREFKSYSGLLRDRDKHVPKGRTDNSFGLVAG